MSAWPQLSEFLAAHHDTPTLSVYLEAAPTDPAASRAVALRLREALERVRDSATQEHAAQRAAIEACLDDVIETIPSAEHRSRRQGWAYFRTADGARLVIDTPPTVETSAAWDLGPRVVPYLRVAELDAALVVQVDRAHTRIGMLHDGIVDTITELEAEHVSDVGPHMSAGPTPGFHRGTHGRPGADEAQRQRREATEHMLAAAVRRIAAVAEDGLPVAVGGSAEMRRRLEQALPSRLRERSVHVESLRMQPADEVLSNIVGALRELRHRQQSARIAELRGEAAHGRAALDLATAQRAAELGAVAELIFSDEAWRAEPAAIEALVHRALDGGAEVAWAPAAVAAGQADGIIAGLRFAL